MRDRAFAATLLFALIAAAVPAGGQSLADVARQEEARRKVIRPADKIFTNRDLPRVGPDAPSTSPAPEAVAESGAPPVPATAVPATAEPAIPAAAAAPDAAATAPPVTTLPGQAKGPVKDQAYWRTRLQALRDQVEQDRLSAEAMQVRVNMLTLEFNSRDNAAWRARSGADRQRAIANLRRLESAVEAGRKAIADLEEEARRAGVPAGWLR